MIRFYALMIIHSILSAFFNYQIIESQDWHISQAASLAPLFGIFFLYKIPWDWRDCIYLIIMALSVRWIVFDISLNIMLGEHWLHIGSGTIDKLIGGWQMYVKLVLIFFLIVFTIQFYKSKLFKNHENI